MTKGDVEHVEDEERADTQNDDGKDQQYRSEDSEDLTEAFLLFLDEVGLGSRHDRLASFGENRLQTLDQSVGVVGRQRYVVVAIAAIEDLKGNIGSKRDDHRANSTVLLLIGKVEGTDQFEFV